MESAIITGATGAIGIALVNKLIENNVKVLVLCRKESKRRNRLPVNPLVTIADCSLSQLSDFENKHGECYDVFYHFAWEGTIGPDRNNWYMQVDNISYTLDAVKLANRFYCKKFVGAGSQAEYGRTNEKLSPNTPAFPENGYGMAKLCAGQMSRELAHQLKMEHIWTRVLSVYGPHDGDSTMIMSTINKLRMNISPEMTKGEQIWDYIFSYDAAEAFYLIGKKGVDGKVYCLGSGNGKPLKEYVETIRNLVSPMTDINFGAIPYGEKQVMYLCADISELEQDTGFTSKYQFESGIKTILEV